MMGNFHTDMHIRQKVSHVQRSLISTQYTICTTFYSDYMASASNDVMQSYSCNCTEVYMPIFAKCNMSVIQHNHRVLFTVQPTFIKALIIVIECGVKESRPMTNSGGSIFGNTFGVSSLCSLPIGAFLT
jgi:hypothetical protein